MRPAANSDLNSLLAVPRRFYFVRPLRLLVSLTPVLMVVSFKLLPFNISQMPIEGAIVLTVLATFIILISAYPVWRLWQPALTLTTRGVELNLSRFFTADFASWESIEGVLVDERKIHGKLTKFVKLVIATDDGKTRESLITITSLQDGEEALEILRRLVPERKPSDLSEILKCLKPLQKEMMHYRDIDLNPAGIVRNGETIPWSNITFLRMEGMVIAGYGSVTIGYAGKSGENKFVIRSSTKEEYLDCIKLILSKASNVSVDPAIIGMLGYTADAARKDGYAVVLIVTGFILLLIGLIVLSFYPPTVGSTWLYPLLLIPLAFAPLVWTLKLLSTRFQGGTANPSRKIIGATLFNLGSVLSVIILFSLSPASVLWLMADASALTGRMDQAERLYMKAEPALEKNEDFIFTLGQFYFRKGEWNKAAGYYIQSYKKDPTNWLPDPLTKIPDSLLKAGRHDDALQWCERIMGQYTGNRQVTNRIERIKREIILALETKKQDAKMQESLSLISEHKNHLDNIGFQNEVSVVQAANELIKLAEAKDDQSKDNLLHEFRIFYYQALSSYNNKNNVSIWQYPLADSEKRKIELSLSKAGWSLKESEGMYYIGDAGGWFEETFKSILTEAYKNYLIIRTKEIKEGFSEDAGLLISWEQLRERIASWEQFLMNYPKFIESPEIQDYLNLYVRTFLTGMDNSRIHDFNSNKLKPEVKTSYEKYIRENSRSAYYGLVKDYYEMLKNNHFNVPDNINEYLEKRGYETMLGKQPPTY